MNILKPLRAIDKTCYKKKKPKCKLFYFCMYYAFWILTCLSNIHILMFLGKLDDTIRKTVITDYEILLFREKAEMMDAPATSLLK